MSARLQAEAALKKGGGLFGAFFGISADTYQDAAEKFQRAGLAFKGSKRCALSAASRASRGGASVALGATYVFLRVVVDIVYAGADAAKAYQRAGECFVSCGATVLAHPARLPRALCSGDRLHGPCAHSGCR